MGFKSEYLPPAHEYAKTAYAVVRWGFYALPERALFFFWAAGGGCLVR